MVREFARGHSNRAAWLPSLHPDNDDDPIEHWTESATVAIRKVFSLAMLRQLAAEGEILSGLDAGKAKRETISSDWWQYGA
jgi:hypothetical protein